MTTRCAICRIAPTYFMVKAENDGADNLTTVDGVIIHTGHARDIESAKRSWTENAVVAADGVITWNTNGHHPMSDMTAAWLVLGYITEAQRTATAAARDIDNARAIAAYRAAQSATPSAEELAEMRAAFGPGAEVVDVITGRRVTT